MAAPSSNRPVPLIGADAVVSVEVTTPLPLPIEIYLVCFGAASHSRRSSDAVRKIKAVQHRMRSCGSQRQCCDRHPLAFFWQFGNFLMGLAVAGGFVQTTRPFQAAQFLRDAALMCFSAALQLRVSASSEGLAKLVA